MEMIVFVYVPEVCLHNFVSFLFNTIPNFQPNQRNFIRMEIASNTNRLSFDSAAQPLNRSYVIARPVRTDDIYWDAKFFLRFSHLFVSFVRLWDFIISYLTDLSNKPEGRAVAWNPPKICWTNEKSANSIW